MRILLTGYNTTIDNSFIAKGLFHHLRNNTEHIIDGWVWDNSYETEFYGWTWSEDKKKMVHATPNPVSPYIDWEYPLTIDKYDLVIHLGALTDTTETNIDKVLEQNFDFSVWLLGQCQVHNIPFHYASSSAVYGHSKEFTETAPMQPLNPYAWSKALFDRVIINNIHKFRAPVLGFRYFNVYGFGEQHKNEMMSVVSKFEKQATMDNEILLFKGSENFERDLVYVEDIYKMHEKLLDCKHSGIYNVGTGKPTNLKALAEKISDLTGCNIFEIDMPDNLKNQYQKYTCSDTRKLDEIVDMEWTDINNYLEYTYNS